MRHLLTLWCVIASLCLSSDTSIEAAETQLATPGIQVPKGFVVELAAGPPLVAHPTMAGFDDRGRLYVCDGAGLNLPQEELEKQLPHFIRCLEDTDGDGRFDKSTIFADKMTFPEGALWYQGALYVASAPSIWRLEDTDGDGVADRREEIVTGFNSIGNAADIHGCFLGPCGRLYWCDGRHGHSIHDKSGRVISEGKAARIFSCRPDGSDLRVHCGGGMDNPVEVDFLPTGEMLGTVNYLYPHRGDCLVHWMYGGVYPRADQPDVLSEFKRTGELLPHLHDFGHVAICAGMCYHGGAYGPEYIDSFFTSEFNDHKVKSVALTRDGSTFRVDPTGVKDFLISSNPDFHPTDVLEDADGSLLVIDTGGWFRIGCPTSQLAKPDVSGAIYRVRKVGAPPGNDPRGMRIDWKNTATSDLVKLLNDPRFAVREKAISELAQRGNIALPALATALKSAGPDARRNAVWALARIATAQANAALHTALADDDVSVRQAAVCAAGTLRDPGANKTLTQLVVADTAPIRREAATALGQLRDSTAVPALFTAIAGDNDRMLEHALIYALIEIDDFAAMLPRLNDPNPAVRRVALIAADQMSSGHLTRELVAPLLQSTDRALQKAALDVIMRHSDWAPEIIGLVRQLMAKPALSVDQQATLRALLLAFCHDPDVQQMMAKALLQPVDAGQAQRLVLSVMEESELKRLPKVWNRAWRVRSIHRTTK